MHLQFIPKNEKEKIFYGKTNEYDKNVADKIDKINNLNHNGASEYKHGNVEIIIPCPDEK